MSSIWVLPAACLSLGLATGADAQMDLLRSGHLSVETLTGAAHELWAIIGPGGKLHPAYFLEHRGHLIIEGLLVTVILFLFLQNAFKPKRRAKAEAPLTDKVRAGPRAACGAACEGGRARCRAQLARPWPIPLRHQSGSPRAVPASTLPIR
jgi:hypothetical protein